MILKKKLFNHGVLQLKLLGVSRSFFLIYFLFLIPYSLFTQNSPYLVPKQIYVGDPATLVVPLPATAQNFPDIVLLKKDFLLNENIIHSNKNIDIHKITLERRTTGGGLLIEFTAFVPGEIELPLIEIGGEYFSGLTVKINSLLDSDSAYPAGEARLLSGAASVLAMPGTALMLYGSLTALIIFILLIIWFIFKGRAVFKELHEKWRRYRLFAGMYNTEKRLAKALTKGTDKRVILDILSFEFREFLSILTGKNCRSMTARDFTREFINEFANTPELNKLDESDFLGEFFDRCDKLRFSGTDIDQKNIERLLINLREYLHIKSSEEKAR